MKKTPLVSIVIPVYNQADYVEESIKSAINQKYANYEIIIHDNASTDGTKEILKKYEKNPKVRVHYADHNHGMVGGWNRVMQMGKGKYIKFLASDDLLAPSCLTELVAVAERHPGASVITCARQLIDAKGKKMGVLKFGNHDEIVNGKEHARWILTTIRENKIGEPTAVLFRRKDIENVGLFDSTFYNFVDFEYWIRLLSLGDLVYVNKLLCSFRIHGETSTSTTVKEGYFIDDTFNLIKKYYSNKILRKKYLIGKKEKMLVLAKKIGDTLKNIKDLIEQHETSKSIKYTSRLIKKTLQI